MYRSLGPCTDRRAAEAFGRRGPFAAFAFHLQHSILRCPTLPSFEFCFVNQGRSHACDHDYSNLADDFWFREELRSGFCYAVRRDRYARVADWLAIAPIWKASKSWEATTDRQSAEDAWVEVDQRMTSCRYGETCDRAPAFRRTLTDIAYQMNIILPIRRGWSDRARPHFGRPNERSGVWKNAQTGNCSDHDYRARHSDNGDRHNRVRTRRWRPRRWRRPWRFGGHGFGHAMGHGGFGGHRVAINRGSIGHGRLDGRRFGRGFYAYGGNYCDPYYYPNGCYGY